MSQRKSSKGSRTAANGPSIWTNRWFCLGVLCVLGLIAYWNSFDAPLVFDDFLTIQRNANVRFGDYLRDSFLWSRSLLFATFALNYIVSGQEVWGYHLVNLLLHLLNGILIFFIAEKIFLKTPALVDRVRIFAFLAAALFVVHPIQTESVTYVSSRSELISTFFYAAALLIFIYWPEQKIGFTFSWLIVLIFLLGLGGKETVISLPAALFLYDFVFISHGSFREMLKRWRFYMTFALAAAGAGYYIATRLLVGAIGSAPGHLPPYQYLLTQFRAIATYVRLVFVPVNLNLDYDFRPSASILEPAVFASLAFILFLIGLGWYYRRTQPIFSFAIFWFFLTLAPTSSFVPILDVFFEHRLYLPMAGVCLAFPLLIDHAADFVSKSFTFRTPPLATCAVILIVFTIATVLRNQVWRDEVRLWSDIVAKSPHKMRPYNALAMSYYKRAQYDNAVEVINRGIQNAPADIYAFRETRGNLYLKLRRYDEAVQDFTAMCREKASAFNYNNLGVAYLYKWNDLKSTRSQVSPEEFVQKRNGILGAASESFIKSLEYDPNNIWAMDSHLNVMFDWEKAESLEAELLAATSKPNFRTLYLLGKLYWLKNDFARADQYLERAEKLNADQKLVFYNHGYALDMLSQTDRAIQKYAMALRLDPTFIEAHHNIALLYMKKREYATALDHFSEVLRMDPNHASTHVNMAKIYINEKNLTQARNHLQIVLSAAPGHQEARALLQRIGG